MSWRMTAGCAALLAAVACGGNHEDAGGQGGASATATTSSAGGDSSGDGGAIGSESPMSCADFADCGDCIASAGCGYCGKYHACLPSASASLCGGTLLTTKVACDSGGEAGLTPSACDGLASCAECLQTAGCFWCAGVCIPGSVVPFPTFEFPYCTDWTAEPSDCDSSSNDRDRSRKLGLFGKGASAGSTLSENLDDLKSNIRWIVVVVQENHSMDNLFGLTKLPDMESLRNPSSPPLPQFLPPWAVSFSFAKKLGTGPGPLPYRLGTACPGNPGHQWQQMHTKWLGGTLAAFAFNPPDTDTMGVLLDEDHLLYTSLAKNFAASDQFFASVLGGTWANRDYIVMAASDGVQSTGETVQDPKTQTFGPPISPTIMDQLNGKSVKWFYAQKTSAPPGDLEAGPMEGTLGTRFASAYPNKNIPYATMLAKFDALDPADPDDAGVFFIDGGPGFDEHPNSSNVHRGEAFIHEALRHLFENNNGAWKNTAVILTYDEGGGYLDHVLPPSAPPPDDATFKVKTFPAQKQEARASFDFHYLGFRVPMILVSPWARSGFVSHVRHSHTSITRLIQARFDLPALTRRDANSDALIDLFDFAAAPKSTTPLLSPGPGVNATDDAKRVWPGALCGIDPNAMP